MGGLWDKLKTRWRLGREVTLWYHPSYDAPSLAKLAESLGMVALRGKRVLAQLAESGLVKSGDLQPFPLVSLADLALFHSQDFLKRAGRKDTLSRIFGLPEYEIKVDDILNAVRWAVSGTLASARSVLAGDTPLAINLGGGFHHAEPEMGSGFCVFNDIGVAVRKIRAEGFDENITIIDLDFHQGNGNIVGFLNDPTVHCYSLHGAVWTAAEGHGNFNRNFEGPITDAQYLGTLEESLPKYLDAAAPGLAFFIAGHDVLHSDPLGQFRLSVAGVEQRDRRILQLLQERKIPGVVTLGGGYSTQACQATLNLVRAALGLDDSLTFEPEAEFSPRLRKLTAGIDPWDRRYLPKDELELSDSDLWQDLEPLASVAERYTAYDIEREMENSGFLEKLRAMGFEDFRVTLDPPEGRAQTVRLEARPIGMRRAPLVPMAQTVVSQESPPDWKLPAP